MITQQDNSPTKSREYHILYRKEKEGGYSGQCLELQAAISQGETLEELKNNMVEAILLVLEHMKSKVNKEEEENLLTLEIPVQ